MLLDEAAEAFRAALRVHTEAEDQGAWARARGNLGHLREVSGARRLRRARAALRTAAERYEATLRVHDPEHMVHDHQREAEALTRVRARLATLPTP